MKLSSHLVYIFYISLVLFQPIPASAVTKNLSAFETAMAAYNKKDYVTALMQWFPLAETNNADAQFMLGRMYLEQDGNGKDVDKAVNWFKRAAELGHLEAQTTLGQMYFTGDVISVDLQLAARYLQQATRNMQSQPVSVGMQPSQLAQVRDNEQNEFNKGLKAYQAQDYTTALMLWLPLTSPGNADALYMIGKLYLELDEGRRNPVKAEYWLKRAAELGHINAQVELGMMYFSGKDIPKNLSQASLWLLRASQNPQQPLSLAKRSSAAKNKARKKEMSAFNR
ncbi:MAG: sel1 repeat family protein, partial [Gammaproteobacteria bacterium]